MAHPTMRRYVCDLIEQGCRCWLATSSPEPVQLGHIVATLHPDVVVLESSTFPACCSGTSDVFPVEHVVVVGPYPDDAYRDAALAAGAGAWIPRDGLSNQLIHELLRITGQTDCTCGCQDPAINDAVMP